ncbi:MAG: 5,10-methylenetetrahydrofolate reductase [Anaerosolibacter sp.]|jgi:5,10-methylenetetrahydrofolate reductase|uniref:methylenetetrahydrofolate reductase n=1 Tax=Anaerosolibacter sp. TaxID=1872527 RepID=UPI0026024723|nr:methylenetetrahydrofolate reductase [Anaerosolibacter sp.]MDF2547268.1 5,10-methylenetetrahydrofolate reductase [Anaerosolibacter sp.]
MVHTLRAKLQKKQFVVTVEMEPPRGADPWGVYEKMRPLAGLVDAVNIADSPMAKMRMSPIALAYLVQNELNLETIFHLTCRDRNQLGLQSELLGAHALGVKNILTLTGDKPEQGDHPQATGVFDVDAIGLGKIANSLNNGEDMLGNAIEGKTNFFIGGVVNPTSDDLEAELEKLHRKIDAGVGFFQTQPIFDLGQLEKFLRIADQINVPIIYGLMPLKSAKLAKYLNRQVPGVHVPDQLIDRLEIKGREAGQEIAEELFKEMKQSLQGVHIFPMGDIQLVETLLKENYENVGCKEAI